jgi:hypothetical protein
VRSGHTARVVRNPREVRENEAMDQQIVKLIAVILILCMLGFVFLGLL